MTQLEFARRGITTSEMKRVAKFENKDYSFIRKGVASGRIVIPKNPKHDISKM